MPCCSIFQRPLFLRHNPQPSVSAPLNPPIHLDETPHLSQPSRPSSRAINRAPTTSVSSSQQHSSPHDNHQVSPPATSLNSPPIVNEAPPSPPPSRPSSRANNSAPTTSVPLSQQQEDPPHQVNDEVPATSSHPSDPPSSDLSALINAALKDYAKQTNIDLPGHPLSARIKEDDTLETVIGVLSEALGDSGDATHKGSIMKYVNRIVNVVLSISGTVGEATGLVSQRVSDSVGAFFDVDFTAVSTRQSNCLRHWYSPICVYLPSLLRVRPLLTSVFVRRQKTLPQLMMLSSTYSDRSGTSLIASRSTLPSHPIQR